MIKFVGLLILLLLPFTQAKKKTIAIIGSNDIHGSAFPADMTRADTGQKYKYGGLAYMGRLIDIIKQEYEGNVLYMDAGDQFQGGIESSKLVSSGKIMNDFFSAMELDASAIGNHEFDFGPDFLLPFMSSKNSPNLAANLKSQRDQKNFLPQQKASKIFQLASGVKIGVIGLSTVQTPSSTAAFSEGLFPPYKFLQYREIVIRESSKLKKAGANAVLILSHVGNSCPLNFTYGFWRESTLQYSCSDDEITQLIDSLPKNTIDGIVQGHRHKIVHHFRKGIPYMGVINGGYYFNVMYLEFDDKNRIIDKVIEGPIPVCEKVFSNTGQCNYLTKQQLESAGQLTNWRFHNQDVYPEPAVQAIFEQQWQPKMNPYFEKLTDNEIDLLIKSTQQSELANLVTDLISQAIPEGDVAIVNPGGFRTEWLPGILQYQHFYNMFPFNNDLMLCDISGKQLVAMLTILQNGKDGFYHSYGLRQSVSLSQSTGQKRFLSAELINGTTIDPEKTYQIILIDFCLSGGDDFKDVINKVYIPRNVRNKGDYKALLKPKIMSWGTIKQGSLIDPNHPRLIVNKVD